ncbi:MAG TPA: phosphonate ABC transporter ATP-binding protein [Caulobacteraceae bacterium]|nr:phosphonate ABC transporter ATP-binding protein [Caulobacteraceae bacterium]
MPSDVAFQLNAVTKTYGARRALDGVDLTVRRGEMVALIGPSGSGKSTLLRALNGLVRIDDDSCGRVEAFGETVQAAGRVSDRIRPLRARIGFIFQSFNLVGRLSLYSNVALGLLGRLPAWRGLFGLWPPAERQGVMAALQRMGVADYAGQKASTLSGGQQQRGAIARAVVQQAEAVLADEPVAALDPVSARKVMELLRDLNRNDGLAVVVTLHQVDYALRYCPRVIALKSGKVVYDGPSEGLDRAALSGIYGAEIEDVFWEGGTP